MKNIGGKLTMKKRWVYEVNLQHKKHENETHGPWVIASSILEAVRSAKAWVRENKMGEKNFFITNVSQQGSIDRF